MMGRWRLCTLALLCGAVLSAAYQLPGKETSPVISDIKYIKCGVCEALAKNAYRQVKAMHEDLPPGKKVCSPWNSMMWALQPLLPLMTRSSPFCRWTRVLDARHLQVTEMEVIEKMEKVAQYDAEPGEWITKIDLVESGSTLKLVEHEELGECSSECKTIQRAAQDIVDSYDTDMAEMLWKVS
jgi:hypothetical protein